MLCQHFVLNSAFSSASVRKIGRCGQWVYSSQLLLFQSKWGVFIQATSFPSDEKKKAARKQSNWKYDIPPQTGVPQKESGCPWHGALHPYEQTMGISLPQDLSICLNALCWQRQTQINNSLKGDPSEGGWLNNLKELMI